jgi:hypothetical protein
MAWQAVLKSSVQPGKRPPDTWYIQKPSFLAGASRLVPFSRSTALIPWRSCSQSKAPHLSLLPMFASKGSLPSEGLLPSEGWLPSKGLLSQQRFAAAAKVGCPSKGLQAKEELGFDAPGPGWDKARPWSTDNNFRVEVKSKKRFAARLRKDCGQKQRQGLERIESCKALSIKVCLLAPCRCEIAPQRCTCEHRCPSLSRCAQHLAVTQPAPYYPLSSC